jgi:hypothetical protein
MALSFLHHSAQKRERVFSDGSLHPWEGLLWPSVFL